MCNVRKYPELYNRADWILRVMGMSSREIGYDLLKRAIVIWQVEGKSIEDEACDIAEGFDAVDTEHIARKLTEELLIKRVEAVSSMAISMDKLSMKSHGTRSYAEQAMLEEIRAVSKTDEKKTILEFVKDVTTHIF